MQSWAAVILAAGKGTRMKSRLSKVLHTIAGREMLRYAVDAVWGAGFERPILVVGHGAEGVRELIGSSVAYAEQQEQLGTGHALLQAKSLMRADIQQVLAINGDLPLIRPETLREVMSHHLATDATLTVLTHGGANPEGLGRVVRNGAGRVIGIVEEAEAGVKERGISELNSGVYCLRANWLWPHLEALPRSASGEYYLTDLIARAVNEGQRVEAVPLEHPEEALGINTRVHLAQAEAIVRQRIRERLMLSGVTIADPPSTFVDADVEIGEDTVILPHTTISGRSRIGRDCRIGPGTIVTDSIIGDGCVIRASMIEESTLEDEVDMGPFSHLRPGSYICTHVHIGNYVEIKKSRLGRDTQVGHFSYIGDAALGERVNIGAGTVTCNFDGVAKHQTIIGDDVFIGSDSMLVAPVTIGDRAATGAGSVVTKDVPPDKLALGVPARIRSKRGPK